jgi:hypothetical protein
MLHIPIGVSIAFACEKHFLLRSMQATEDSPLVKGVASLKRSV